MSERTYPFLMNAEQAETFGRLTDCEGTVRRGIRLVDETAERFAGYLARATRMEA